MSEGVRIEDALLTNGRLMIAERTSAVVVEARSHERLREVLAKTFGGAGTMTSFERVLGWVHGESGVEVHVQIAPSASGGSTIRLVQHGVVSRRGTLALLGAGIGAVALVSVAAVMALGHLRASALLLAITIGTPMLVVGLVAALVHLQRRRHTAKLEAGADALVAALAIEGEARPNARVEIDAADADAVLVRDADLVARAERRCDEW